MTNNNEHYTIMPVQPPSQNIEIVIPIDDTQISFPSTCYSRIGGGIFLLSIIITFILILCLVTSNIAIIMGLIAFVFLFFANIAFLCYDFSVMRHR